MSNDFEEKLKDIEKRFGVANKNREILMGQLDQTNQELLRLQGEHRSMQTLIEENKKTTKEK